MSDWFRSQVPDAFSKTAPEVDALILDLSALLEETFKVVFQSRATPLPLDTLETEFYSLIPQKINDRVRTYLPRQSLMIALDGVMTLLEMQALKQRSYYRSLTRATDIVDNSGLLPGTDWMFKIKNQLSAFPTDATLRPYVTIISHMTVPGSALEKILTYLRSHAQYSSLILCPDPERMHLLMLGALLIPQDIYLSSNGKEYISIAALRKYFITAKNEASPDEIVVLTLLLGSAWHPAIPSFGSGAMTAIYEAYLAFPDIFLAQDQGSRYIDWQVLARLLAVLSAAEPNRLAEIAFRSANGEYKYPFTMVEQAISGGKFYLNLFRAPWYRRALGVQDESLALTITGLLGAPELAQTLTPKVTQVQDMASDYLMTLGWIYLFLQGGKVYRQWLYRYHHAPLCSDIALIARNADSIYLYGYRGIVPEIPIHLIQQLSAVLPFISRDILPSELQPLFDIDSPLYPLTPTRFPIQNEGKRSPREGTIIPFIDISKVQLAWALNLTKTDRSRITSEKEYIYQLTSGQLNMRQGLIESELAARKLAQERLEAQVTARQDQVGTGRGRGKASAKPFAPRVPSAVPKMSSTVKASPKSSSSVYPSPAAPKIPANPKLSGAVKARPKISAAPKFSSSVKAFPKLSATPNSRTSVRATPKSSASPAAFKIPANPKSSSAVKARPKISAVSKMSPNVTSRPSFVQQRQAQAESS